MTLTPAQLQTLKTNMAADGVINAMEHTPDNADAIAKLYALPASPNFTVWKTNVTLKEIGDNLVGTDLAGLTTGNQTRLQTIAIFSQDGINAALADRRAFFDDIFSGAGGAATRAKLLILWKRLANRAEKLYATGTGSDASPATLTFEGTFNYIDVQQAWELP